LHATARNDAGTAPFSGAGGTRASSSGSTMTGVAGKGAPAPLTGVSVPPPLPGNGSSGIGIGAAHPPPPTLPPVVVKPPPPATLPPPPGDSADAGVPPSYVFGGMYGDGRVVAAFWDGAREPAVLVDPRNGASTVVGYLGNLHFWQSQLVYDGRTNVLYALGSDVNDVPYVYTLRLDTRSVRTVPQGPAPQRGGSVSYIAGGVTSDGLLVVTYWTGALWVVAMLDPATGTVKDVGTFSGAYYLADRVTYNDTTRMIYALGQNENETQQKIYSLALDTGKTQAADVATTDNTKNIVLGQVTPKDQLLVAYWNDPAQREEVGLMDPLTGKIAMAGVLNGLHWWSDQMTYASTSGTVVAYGQGMDAGDPWQFYETTIAQ
jgi:hypothetical protein